MTTGENISRHGNKQNDTMKKYAVLKTVFLLSILCLILPATAQDKGPYQVLDRVRNKLEAIQDYHADVAIRVDVDFIRMPEKHASVFYKAPGKTRFKSDEFIMLPKKGTNFSALNLLEGGYTAIYAGTATIDDRQDEIIKVIPMKQKSDIVLSTLWVDTVSYRVMRVESTTRESGSYTIDFTYHDPSLPLPSVMKISFEIQNFNIPLKFIGKGVEIDRNKLDSTAVKRGVVILTFSNYQINKGINEKVFEEEDQNRE
jgi:outer membrane lipoprotein-sorting protein